MTAPKADRGLSRAVARAMDPPPAPQHCHVNAWRALSFAPPGAVYVEGWAMLGPVGVWHSWLEVDDRVADVTWRRVKRMCARYRAVRRYESASARAILEAAETLPVMPPPPHPQGRDPRCQFRPACPGNREKLRR